ncbi:methyltransferase domain-containing protein [Rubellimicrobium aerolatum]|uniref:Methyltransferase domain-containing protein n=1 Tax=Rubellimicrobium aerolatum TaxID=490979 RepID=A0ABW0SGR5_9RHOB|nr:methyltransferase domain-containing protein [Rubellimicrobium aerolatum]MBP1807537.1 SAM-dependent methyltransferase [Rubellimicrobium aerolatum]
MTADLSRRSDASELMDDPGTDYATFRDCLRDLARVNRMSLGYRPTLAFLEGLRRAGRLDLGRPVEVLDAGSGYGDLLRAVDAWAEGQGLAVRLTGVDLNPWSARAAAEATPDGRPIRWVTENVFDHDGGADVVVSSLFTHHLEDTAAVAFLRWMEAKARVGWFVNDLHRHPLPHRTFGPLAAALRLHRFVRHDGPVSFARAFVPDDWARLLREAGVPDGAARVERWVPFRLCVARAR